MRVGLKNDWSRFPAVARVKVPQGISIGFMQEAVCEGFGVRHFDVHAVIGFEVWGRKGSDTTTIVIQFRVVRIRKHFCDRGHVIISGGGGGCIVTCDIFNNGTRTLLIREVSGMQLGLICGLKFGRGWWSIVRKRCFGRRVNSASCEMIIEAGMGRV